ncbi:MAG: PD-(D/E)XK nuclease family protein [Pseudomonadota bacterium]
MVLYLKWQAEDFISGYVRRLFSGGYLDLDRIELEGEKPSSGKAAAIIREAGIGWGRERYSSRLKALEESCLTRAEERRENGEEEKAERAEKEAAQAAWVSRFIEKILASIIHKDPEETVTLENVCRGAVEFLENFCRIAGEMDAGARNKLVEILNALAQSPSASDTAKDMLERIIGIAKETSIGHSNPKPGHVHVSHYRSGGYIGRANTFVLGVDQAKFPGPLLQDPVILDREREKLSSTLPLARDLLEENLYSMSKMLCSLNGRVTLSYSCRDLREDRDLFPSSILLSAYRLITGNRAGDYSDLKRFLGQPSGFVPLPGASPLNYMEWWLNQRDLNYGSDSILASYGHLLEGEHADIERERETLTEYEGWLPSSRGALDPLNSDAVLSCSRLEDLAKCPFAFFIRHVLGIEPLEDLEKDPGRWLDPLQRGELLHDVFCRFMEELKSKEELPELSKHLERLETIAMEEVEQWKEEVPPSSELTLDREVKDIRLTLEIFLRDEEERCKAIKPEFFELSFGTSWDKRCGTMVEEPVEIVLNKGRSFKLRGRIDRVDQSGEHEFEVWDYKTGSAYAYKEEGYLNQGKHLQHALYAAAAEILLRKQQDKKARVVRSGYFFLSPKGEGHRIEKDQLNRDELYEVLEDLFALFRTGVFPATYDKDNCRFCDYIKTCGGEKVAVKRTVRKIGNDEKMSPFERLKGHA